MTNPTSSDAPLPPSFGAPEPGAAPTAQPSKGRLGTFAVVLGILGILFSVIPPTTAFGIFLGVVGLVLGIIALRRKTRRARLGTILSVIAIVLGAIISAATSGGASDSAAPVTSPSASAPAESAAAAAAPVETAAAKPSEAAKPAEPAGTAGEVQALLAAKGYLSSGIGFSQASLLEQLTSSAGNGFPQADAQWAIDHSAPDWNAQALDAAKGYLKSGIGFSEASLTQQLTSTAGNQFTPEQAAAAVAASGADWNAQAVLAAKGYVSSGMGFSRASLIEQLSSSAGNQFTQPQAEYAATQAGLN